MPEEPLGLIEEWADEQPNLSVQVGDWEYRAGLAPPAAGATYTDIGPDERFVLVFLEVSDLDELYRGRYYIAAKPLTPFASLRLYVHEIGREMRVPDPRRWGDWGGWDPPDR